MPNMPISTPYLYPVNIFLAVKNLMEDLSKLIKTGAGILVIILPFIILIVILVFLHNISVNTERIYRLLNKTFYEENFESKIKAAPHIKS